MGTSKNPFRVGDPIAIQRGEGWITGTVVKTVLARCFVKIGDRVFVDDYHDWRRAKLESANE